MWKIQLLKRADKNLSTDYLVNIASQRLYENVILYPLSPGFKMGKFTLKTVIAAFMLLRRISWYNIKGDVSFNCWGKLSTAVCFTVCLQFSWKLLKIQSWGNWFSVYLWYHFSFVLVYVFVSKLKCSVEKIRSRANQHIRNAWSKVAGSSSYNETLVTMKTHIMKLRKRARIWRHSQQVTNRDM